MDAQDARCTAESEVDLYKTGSTNSASLAVPSQCATSVPTLVCGENTQVETD